MMPNNKPAAALPWEPISKPVIFHSHEVPNFTFGWYIGAFIDGKFSSDNAVGPYLSHSDAADAMNRNTSQRIYGRMIWCQLCEDYRDIETLLDGEACSKCRLIL